MAAAGENNPLGLGPRDRESSNTGSTEDTSYNAHGSDRYQTGEVEKDLGDQGRGDGPRDGGQGERSRSVPADENVPSSDEP